MGRRWTRAKAKQLAEEMMRNPDIEVQLFDEVDSNCIIHVESAEEGYTYGLLVREDTVNGTVFRRSESVNQIANLIYMYQPKDDFIYGPVTVNGNASLNSNTGVDWSYYERFQSLNEQLLPGQGEGDTMATQIVTAINKLVYKWYNDGDVFDNTGYLDGWGNDLSSYANWLFRYIPETRNILSRISDCRSDGDYETLLKDLTDLCMDEKFLQKFLDEPKRGFIYECSGPFEFVDEEDDEWDDWDDDEY